MTTTLESRKLQIIDRIVALDNEHLMRLIETLLNSENDFWNELSEVQKAKIEQAIRDLDAGKGISHETVVREFRNLYTKKTA
ncbi:MAG: hypothetical protein OHK0019_12830 [Saprospiraceae bacterium]